MLLPARVRRAPVALLSVLAVLAGLVGLATPASAVPGTGSNVWINEIHYDNIGVDEGENIEVVAPAGTDLSGWSLVRYNGSTPSAAVVYPVGGSTPLGTVENSGNGWGFYVVEYPTDGLQNGGNDGVALVNASGTVVQLLSYEGTLTAAAGATGGPAAGQTSTDIGRTQSNATTAAGNSIQLTGGPGNDPSDFTWAATSTSTFGQANTGQTFISDGDSAPAVSSTTPANNATDVPVDSNVTVTFSEPVHTESATFDLTCANSGAHGFSAEADATETTYTIDPTDDFAEDESCTLTVVGAEVQDRDLNDPPDTMTADHTITFSTAPPPPTCEDAFTPIYQLQGAGTATTMPGTRTTEGVVVGDFQGNSGLNGFFLQDLTGDSNAATSDGIFVFVPAASPFASVSLAVGDVVHLQGRVTEFNTLTEIDNVTQLLTCGTAAPPAPTVVDLPEAENGDLEQVEGMSITIPEPLTVEQNFFQGRYGQVTLGAGGRLFQPTNMFPAGTPQAEELADRNARSLIVLDDGSGAQNRDPVPYLGTGVLRAGDTLTGGLTGVLDYGQINSVATIRDYRVHPTIAPQFSNTNPRTAAPAAVGGNLKVASFNVLNYFTDLSGRGANSAEEFDRQRTKIISAMSAIDADVFGLMEIQNDTTAEPGVEPAIANLVAGLNEATAPGTYAVVDDTGLVMGGDEIKVAMIYKPARVALSGPAMSHNVPVFNGVNRGRVPLAQTFQLISTGEKVSVVVNHFKSKSCGTASGADADQGDGQGCWNDIRVQESESLLGFIDHVKDVSGDDDVLVIGDLNAYAQEDPILTLLEGGLVDEARRFVGNDAYSYVFDGMSGYLDHGLATQSLDSQATGLTEWHINADEPSVIDYNVEFKTPGQVESLYSPDAYRSSDHDPVVIGLELGVRQCQFSDNAATSTRTLLSDCDTSRTILVPDGWTLDGAGHSITAKDPADGQFVGAVVRNAGTSASVRNLTVTASSLNDVCDGGDDRLRGILLDGASGSILNNHVLGINQGASGCQEGNAIEVRNAPFDDTGVDTNVLISGNEVRDYQKGGIISNGSVNVTVLNNTVEGVGPVDYIAQNGVQFGFGATGVAEGNTISDNFYTGPDLGCGLLFFEADGVKQKKNTFSGNEKDICNFGRGGGGSPTKK